MTDDADVKLDLVLRQQKTINGEPRTLKATAATIVDMLDLAAGPISAVLYIAVQIAANLGHAQPGNIRQAPTHSGAVCLAASPLSPHPRCPECTPDRASAVKSSGNLGLYRQRPSRFRGRTVHNMKKQACPI